MKEKREIIVLFLCAVYGGLLAFLVSLFFIFIFSLIMLEDEALSFEENLLNVLQHIFLEGGIKWAVFYFLLGTVLLFLRFLINAFKNGDFNIKK